MSINFYIVWKLTNTVYNGQLHFSKINEYICDKFDKTILISEKNASVQWVAICWTYFWQGWKKFKLNNRNQAAPKVTRHHGTKTMLNYLFYLCTLEAILIEWGEIMPHEPYMINLDIQLHPVFSSHNQDSVNVPWKKNKVYISYLLLL